jgi:hypothetical protein
MEKAYNPSTGEVLFLVDNQWTKPEQVAENPKTGERAYLVNNQWEIFKPPAATAPKAAPAAAPKAAPAAAPKAAPAAAPTEGVTTSPMGDDALGSAIMNAAQGPTVPTQKREYTGSVFDTVTAPEPKFNPAEAQRLSRREYAQREPQPPSRYQEVRATPESETRDRTVREKALDASLGVFQGGVGFFKGITDNLPGLSEDLGLDAVTQGLERLKSPQLRSSSAGRTALINAARKNQGELAATRAAFSTLFSPAGADILAQGGGSMVPTVGMSLMGLGVKAMAAANALATAGESANKTAEALEKISPEDWSKNDMYQTLRERGLSHRDTVKLLSPIYAIPAQTAGGAAGYLSGRIGLESALAGKAADRSIRGRAGRAGAELGGEELETLAPGLVSNLTQGALDETVSPLSGLGQEAVETAVGTVPGAALAARAKARPPAQPQYQRDTSYEGYSEALARSKGFLTPTPREQVPETAGPLGAMGAVRPGQEAAQPSAPAEELNVPAFQPPTPPAPTAETEEEGQPDPEQIKAEIAQEAAKLETRGISEEDSLRLATKRVQKKYGLEDLGGFKTAAIPDVSNWTDANLASTLEFQLSKPEQAPEMVTADTPREMRSAQNKPLVAAIQAEIQKRAADQGAKDVAGTDTTAGGAGAPVVGQPGAGSTAPGVGAVEPSGVVSAGQDVGATPAGEAVQQPALTLDERIALDEAEQAKADAKRAEAQQVAKTNFDAALDQVNSPEYGGDIDAALDSYRQNTIDTLVDNGETDQFVIRQAEDAFDRLATEYKTKQAPATETPAAKRGRPAVYTPEQKAANKVSADAKKAVKMQADRDVTRAVAALDATSKPLDEGEFEDEEQLALAQEDRRSKRTAAIRSLLQMASNPFIERGSATGKRVQAALKHASIKPAEVEAIKKGLERSKKALADKAALLGEDARVDTSFARSTAKVDKPDRAYNKMTTGQQALRHVIKTGNGFQKYLARRLLPFVKDVRFQVIEEDAPLPPQITKGKAAKDWDMSRGLFLRVVSTGERFVFVRGGTGGPSQGINNVTVLHEMLHAALNKKIEMADYALVVGFDRRSDLAVAYGGLTNTIAYVEQKAKVLREMGRLPPFMEDLIDGGKIFKDNREFVAYAMSDPQFQEFLMNTRGFAPRDPSLFTRFVSNVRRFFNMKPEDASALADVIDVTDKMLSARMTAVMRDRVREQQEEARTAAEISSQDKRTLQELDEDIAKAKDVLANSRLLEEARGLNLLQLARDPQKVAELIPDIWSKMDYAQRSALVKMPTFDYLAKWAERSGVPRIQEIQADVQRMLGMSQQLLTGAGQVIDATKRAFDADPTLRRKLEDLPMIATISRYDPADTKRLRRNVEVDDMYKDLGPNGQEAYLRIRDYYKDISDLYTDLLDEQIASLQGVSDEQKNRLMVLVRKTFEADAKIDPFFPLVRAGDFWLSTGKGEDRKFVIFESREKRNKRADELMKTGVDVDVGNDMASLRKATKDSSMMLKQLFDAVDSANFAVDSTDPKSLAAARDGMKDAMYQIYLNGMPEQSFRKMFIHRKNRAGFRTDILQNLATTASKNSIQLARLKYGPKLRNNLSAAKDSIVGREELTPFVQEAERRVNLALSGEQGGLSEGIAGVANKASFIWYMSGASSALIQPFSLFISGLPVLGANHGDMVGAARELGKMVTYLNQYGVVRKNADGTTSYVAPSLANNTSLSLDERRAVREMVQQGVQQSTYASLVWGYKQTPTDQLDSIPQKGKALANVLVGGLLHNMERLTREAVYLASYRLGIERGLSPKEAVQQAVSDTNEALGNYDITNRPRWMQTGIGKMAFQFKMYPLQMTLLMLTNFKRMLPLLNKEGKKEAATKFFGVFATAGILGGYTALPMFSAVAGLLGWAWKEFGKDPEWPDELKDKSYETWVRKVFLPEKLGDINIGGVPLNEWLEYGPINAVTGWDISSRIGLNDLWGRDSKETKSARDSFIAWFIDHFGGPTASLGLSWIDAAEAFALGDYQKGVERMAPAAIRNLVIANKYADEGMLTAAGKEIVPKDDVRFGELLGQSIGFRPERLAKAQEFSFKATGIEQKILNERDFIMKKLNIAHRKGRDAEFERIIDKEVDKFNTKNPLHMIEAEDIYNSIIKQAELRESARLGLNITEKNAHLFDEAMSIMEKQAEKERKK